MNADLDKDLRLETRISPTGMAAVVLQPNPDAKKQWLPVASWGRTIELLDKTEPAVVLELKACREACWKLVDVCAFACPGQLQIAISPQLKALLKVAPLAHRRLHSLLVDLMMYHPKLVAADARLAPDELGMTAPAVPEEVDADWLDAEKALKQSPMNARPCSRFKPGPAVHAQFDGGS